MTKLSSSVFSASNLRILRAISESKNMTDAAIHLGLTQSAVSRSIQRLEKTLGVPLFERKVSPTQMTSLGRFISSRAADILEDMDALIAEIRIKEVGGTSLVRLASSTSITQTIIPYVVCNLYRNKVKVCAFNGNTPKVCKMLLDDKVDIALASDPMHAYRAVISIPIYEEKYMAVVPIAHQKSIRTTVDLLDMAKLLPCIQFNEHSYDVVHTSRVLQQWGIKNSMKLNGIWSALQMVKSGKAWALMPTLNLLPARDHFEGCGFLYVSPQQGTRQAFVLYKNHSYANLAQKIAGLVTDAITNEIEPMLEGSAFKGSVRLIDEC